MLNYIRIIAITFVGIFLHTSIIIAEELNNDENKINNGTYVYDPFENINRTVLTFNIIIDDIAIQPVITTYKALTPDIAEKGFTNFFSNLKEPLNSVSFLLQGDAKNSLNSLGRFLTNSITSLGIYDTSQHLGLKKKNSDIGVAIGKAGIPSGPFLIIPLLGPSNLRDLTGNIANYYLDPVNIVSNDFGQIKTTGTAVSNRSEYDKELNDLKNNSIDLYDSIKLLYHQRRMGQINEHHLKDLPVPNIYIELK